MGFCSPAWGSERVAWPAFAPMPLRDSMTLTIRYQLTGIVTKIEWMNPHARFYIGREG